MSLVCASYVSPTSILFAADSGIFCDDHKTQCSMFKKLKKFSSYFVIGAAGNMDEICAMQRWASSHEPTEGIFKFMQDFYEDWRAIQRNFPHRSEDTAVTTEYLIGYKGTLYACIGAEVRTITPTEGSYAAIGAGMPYATMALELGCPPDQAVAHTADLCVWVQPPVITEQCWNR